MHKSYEYIEAAIEGKLGFIALNRPVVLNTINRQMIAEILSVLEKFEEDENVKVIGRHPQSNLAPQKRAIVAVHE